MPSENGWPVIDQRADLVWFTAAGERFAAANVDVALIGQTLINRYSVEVEPIVGPVLDDWSWAVRPVRGSSTVTSNHASATAWDLNALKHPRGVKRTFSIGQMTVLLTIKNTILDDAGAPVLRWGGLFTTTVDEMHWEIAATPERVRQAADILRSRIPRGDDMNWLDKVPLTASDAAAFGNKEDGTPYKAGDEVYVADMIKYPPGVRKLRREVAALQADVDALKLAK